jgi:hypothetical protein
MTEDAGPDRLALLAEKMTATIAELEAERARVKTRRERKPLNSRLHAARMVLAWVRSRAGYVAPVE